MATESPAPSEQPRAPCVRLHIPVLDAGCEISWGAELRKRDGPARSNGVANGHAASSSVSPEDDAPPPPPPAPPPKKPVIAYIHFCNEVRPQLKAEQPDIHPTELMKKLGEQWAALADKSKYEALHKADAERYAKECADAGLDPEEPNRPKQPAAKRGLDFPRPQNRFHQMVQEMERKYATARALPPSTKRPAERREGKKPKKAKAANTGGDGPSAEGDAADEGGERPPAPEAEQPPAGMDADVGTLSVSVMKGLISAAGLSPDGCIERPDLEARAREAQAALKARATAANGSAAASAGSKGVPDAGGGSSGAPAAPSGPRSQPPGRPPHGHTWDAERGAFVNEHGQVHVSAQQQRARRDEDDGDDEDDEGDGEGGDDASDSGGSWYVSDDGFIDDSELLDEMDGDEAMMEDDEDDDAPPQLKASGFFISRGELLSAEALARQARLQAEREEEERRQQQQQQPRRRAFPGSGANPWSIAGGVPAGVKGPKKPATAYNLFCVEMRAKLKAENPLMPLPELSRMLVEMWRKLQDRSKYQELHRKDVERYNRECAEAPRKRMAEGADGSPSRPDADPTPVGQESGAATPAKMARKESGGPGRPGNPGGPRTDCTQWRALCRIAHVLGETVADELVGKETEEYKGLPKSGARFDEVHKAVAEASVRLQVTITMVKDMLCEQFRIELAACTSWSRLARSLSTKISLAQAATLVPRWGPHAADEAAIAASLAAAAAIPAPKAAAPAPCSVPGTPKASSDAVAASLAAAAAIAAAAASSSGASASVGANPQAPSAAGAAGHWRRLFEHLAYRDQGGPRAADLAALRRRRRAVLASLASPRRAK